MATLKIKVPIYISSILEDAIYSYPEMCRNIKNVIDDYNNLPPDDKLSITQRAKLKQKVIKFIHYDQYGFGENNAIPALLLRIEEFKRNNKDMYIQASTATEQRDIAFDDRVGSNYNYVLLYPLIRYLRNGGVENRWVAFVYNDPSKEDTDIKTTIYSVLSKILGLSVKMVIRESTRRRLCQTSAFPKVTASYVTVDNRPGDRTNLQHFEVSCKSSRKVVYENLPQQELMQLMNETPNDAISKQITVQFSKNESVKMKYELNDAQVLMQTLIEESNGYEIALTQEEVDAMHEAPNVKHHLGEIITRFLCNENPTGND